MADKGQVSGQVYISISRKLSTESPEMSEKVRSCHLFISKKDYKSRSRL